MRDIKYRCNLCTKYIENLSNGKTLYWKADTIPQRFVLVDIQKDEQYDKQICINCIRTIKEFNEKNDK